MANFHVRHWEALIAGVCYWSVSFSTFYSSCSPGEVGGHRLRSPAAGRRSLCGWED